MTKINMSTGSLKLEKQEEAELEDKEELGEDQKLKNILVERDLENSRGRERETSR